MSAHSAGGGAQPAELLPARLEEVLLPGGGDELGGPVSGED